MKKTKSTAAILAVASAVLLAAALLFFMCLQPQTEKTKLEPKLALSGAEIQNLASVYLSIDPYSKKALIKELENTEKIEKEKVCKAVEEMNVDWRGEAVKSAERMLSSTGTSKKTMRRELIASGYTKTQVDYAIQNCKADWKMQAVIKAKMLLEFGASEEVLKEKLINMGFTEEEASYGAEKAVTRKGIDGLRPDTHVPRYIGTHQNVMRLQPGVFPPGGAGANRR